MPSKMLFEFVYYNKLTHVTQDASRSLRRMCVWQKVQSSFITLLQVIRKTENGSERHCALCFLITGADCLHTPVPFRLNENLVRQDLSIMRHSCSILINSRCMTHHFETQNTVLRAQYFPTAKTDSMNLYLR